VSDLEAYARSRGLPTSYISGFVAAVHGDPSLGNELGCCKITGECSSTPIDCPPCGAGSTGSTGSSYSAAAGTEVSFRAFVSFVKSRELALRRAFDLFDKDHDGVISRQDLEASLAHVAVCCPQSRCIYRCRRKLAADMFDKASAEDAGGNISYQHFRDFFLLLPQTDMMVEYWLASGRCPDLDTRVMYHDEGEQGGSKASPWGHLLAGAVAGAASRTATAPLETMRLAVMTGTLEASNLMQAAETLMERGGGWRALFRGNALNVMRSAPQKALDFFAFDTFKKLLGDEGSYVKTFAAAGMAGAASWTMLYPLEVVRSRITCGALPPTSNVLAAAKQIIAAEGPRSLYRGLGWSVAAIMPEAAICYGLHDLLKRAYKNVHGVEPGVLPSLAAGVLSAFTGQLVAFPLETISRRLQVSGQALPAVMSGIIAQGGLPALYRGVGAATLRLVPMACISFGTYELVRALLVKLEEVQDSAEAEREYAHLHRYVEPLQVAAAAAVTSARNGGTWAGEGSAGGSASCSSCVSSQAGTETGVEVRGMASVTHAAAASATAATSAVSMRSSEVQGSPLSLALPLSLVDPNQRAHQRQ